MPYTLSDAPLSIANRTLAGDGVSVNAPNLAPAPLPTVQFPRADVNAPLGGQGSKKPNPLEDTMKRLGGLLDRHDVLTKLKGPDAALSAFNTQRQTALEASLQSGQLPESVVRTLMAMKPEDLRALLAKRGMPSTATLPPPAFIPQGGQQDQLLGAIAGVPAQGGS